MKAKNMESWFDMYVYQADVMKDLFDALYEYIIESEHCGMVANAKEISVDTVDDIKSWVETRKEKLLKDFCLYYTGAYGWND